MLIPVPLTVNEGAQVSMGWGCPGLCHCSILPSHKVVTLRGITVTEHMAGKCPPASVNELRLLPPSALQRRRAVTGGDWAVRRLPCSKGGSPSRAGAPSLGRWHYIQHIQGEHHH